MEFKEFTSPEKRDYDIYDCFNEEASNKNIPRTNPYVEQLIELIGILEDVTEEGLQADYGISMQEYFHPTAEVILKVMDKLNNRNSGLRK